MPRDVHIALMIAPVPGPNNLSLTLFGPMDQVLLKLLSGKTTLAPTSPRTRVNPSSQCQV